MYVLHACPDTASTIVRLVLEELGQPYRIAPLDMDAGDHTTSAYRRVNPNGQIPALETPDGPIFETAAIVLWLSETHGALAPAPGTPDRAAFLKWLFFTSNTLHADMRQLFYPHKYAGDAPEAQAAHHAVTVARIGGHLALLDRLLGGDDAPRPEWLATKRPGVLDFYLVVLLRWLALYPRQTAGWFDLAATPHLAALAQAVEQSAAVLRVAAAEGMGTTPFSAPAPFP